MAGVTFLRQEGGITIVGRTEAEQPAKAFTWLCEIKLSGEIVDRGC